MSKAPNQGPFPTITGLPTPEDVAKTKAALEEFKAWTAELGMPREELIQRLRDIKEQFGTDPEVAHGKADQALLDYIGDSIVREAYDAIEKWFA